MYNLYFILPRKYLKDTERNELFQKAIMYCVSSFRAVLKKHAEAKNNTAIMNLLLDISKAHRKSMKYMNQKDSLFSAVLSEVYKAYVEDKVQLPDNANLVDLALKLCEHEVKYRKYQEKLAAEGGNTENIGPGPMRATSGENPFIPGVSKPRKSLDKTPKMPILSNPIISPSKIPSLLQNLDLAKLQELHSNPISSSIPGGTAAAAAATSSSAYKDSLATLAGMMNAQSALNAINPFGAGLNTMETMALLSLLQQQSNMYSQFSALTSQMSSAPNYNQFLNKYMQDLLGGGMTGMGMGANVSGKAPAQQRKDTGSNKKEKKEKKPKTGGASGTQINQNPMSLLKDIAMKGGVSVLPVSNKNSNNESNKRLVSDFRSNTSTPDKPKPKKQKLNSGETKAVSFSPAGLPQVSFADFVQLDLPKSLSITPSASHSPSPVLSTPSGLTISPSKSLISTSNLSPSSNKQGLTVTPVSNSITNSKPKQKKQVPHTYKNIPGLNSLSSLSVTPSETKKMMTSPFQMEFAKQMTLSSTIDLTKSPNSMKKARDSPKNFNQKQMKSSSSSNKTSNKLPPTNYNQFPNLKLPEISVSPVLSHSPSGSGSGSKPGTPNSGSSRTNPVPARNSQQKQQQQQTHHNKFTPSTFLPTPGGNTGGGGYKPPKQLSATNVGIRFVSYHSLYDLIDNRFSPAVLLLQRPRRLSSKSSLRSKRPTNHGILSSNKIPKCGKPQNRTKFRAFRITMHQ